ncbi:hypothetical protein L596_030196 [Steinernema carpocapsae]|uniref:G-protein coupled receptors family 1 profile domain-containing protein n=1 Tax=Steinernema carpocapsae TaxID=34508 RepID=A0A4U5LS05_STECR|nr:hypothetical protein L596_030196 [Steinernema carpocapsae]
MSELPPSDMCASAFRITGNEAFIGIQWGRVCGCLLGCVCAVASAVYVIRSKLYHTNLRILIVNISLTTIGYCALLAYRSIIYLVTFYSHDDPCSYMISKNTCAIQMASAAALYQACISSILASAIERTFATFWNNGYEHTKSCVLTLALAVLTWWQPLFTLVMIFAVNPDEHELIEYCSAQTIGKYSLRSFNYALFISIVISIIIYGLLFWYNRKLAVIYHKSPRNLSQSYQLHENIHTTRSVLLSACILTTLTLINFVLAGIGRHFFESTESFAIVKELTNMSIPIFSIAHFIALIINKTLKFIKRGQTEENHRRLDNIHNYGQSNEYFAKLRKYWAENAKK